MLNAYKTSLCLEFVSKISIKSLLPEMCLENYSTDLFILIKNILNKQILKLQKYRANLNFINISGESKSELK